MINGAEVLAILKWPGAFVGGVVGLVIIFTSFGFNISSPGDRWDEHDTTHTTISDTLAEIDTHLEEQQILIEAMVRGECIENPIEDLQRQGLITTCERLGIQR